MYFKKKLVVLLFALLIVLSGCSYLNKTDITNTTDQSQNQESYDINSNLSNDSPYVDEYEYTNIPLSDDLSFLFDKLENNHASFFLNEVPKEYYIQKHYIEDNFENIINDDNIFEFEVKKLLATLNDCHLSLISQNQYSNIRLKYIDNKLLLVENDVLTQFELKSINDLDVSKFTDIALQCYPIENDSSRDLLYERETLSEFTLKNSGIDTSGSMYATFIDVNTSESITREITLGQPYYEEPKPLSIDVLNDDIIYIDMDQCNLGIDLDIIVDDLEDKISNGYEKIIVDLRGNSGGNSQACQKLLFSMGMFPPEYGVYIPYTELSQEYFFKDMDDKSLSAIKERGFVRENPTLSTAMPNNSIQLVVLVDKNTFSAATMMAVWVKDGKLGTVIGEISGQSPSFHGDISFVEFPNKDMSLCIPIDKAYRPDHSASETMLIPDIQIKYNEDALEKALNFFEN